MEDCVYGDAKTSVAVIAMMALFFGNRRDPSGATINAFGLVSPSDFFKVGNAISFGGESLINLDYVHLPYLLMGQG